VLTVEQHAFTESGGDYDDTDAFEVGDRVRVYGADLHARSSVTYVTAKSGTTVTLNDAVTVDGGSPASGMWLQHADYADTGMTSTITDRYTFCAGSDEKLGTADRPHVYG
jgi:hypothetical protein